VGYFPAVGQLHELEEIVAAVAEGAAEVELVGCPDAGQVGVDENLVEGDALIPDFLMRRANGLHKIGGVLREQLGLAGAVAERVEHGTRSQRAAHEGAVALAHAIEKGLNGLLDGLCFGGGFLGVGGRGGTEQEQAGE